jgi:tRNA-2-methylthio-N6-dimethylallyladenosine synthase
MEEDFLETLEVVKRVGFDSAFTFIYSKRTGTPAATMEGQVEASVSKERFDRLLKEVQTGSAKAAGREEHTVQKVLVEEVNSQNPELLTGRLSNNFLVHFQGEESLIGKMVDVYLQESKGFYYMGSLQ